MKGELVKYNWLAAPHNGHFLKQINFMENIQIKIEDIELSSLKTSQKVFMYSQENMDLSLKINEVSLRRVISNRS